MQHLKLSGKTGDEAVSSVVAVMLMLVVTIIIAAVVSGFAGGILGDNQKAPTLTMDAKVINMGSWTGSGFYAKVTSVSKPIPTGDLKIMTSWTAADGTSGGNTVLPNASNTQYVYPYAAVPSTRPYIGWNAPWGAGPGLDGSITRGGGGAGSTSDTNPYKFTKVDQQFGFYELVPGTTLMARPYGHGMYTVPGKWREYHIEGITGSSDTIGYGVTTPYVYTDPSHYTDSMRAVFGKGWENLSEGDTVNIRVIHVPTGKVIYNKDVPVTEG
ncbi:MAG: type IV pilin N-terminal domain-containing protein [Methanospirillum sp.]|nr:type IV pilin N-terminal domain-containing protein [Methanospirillum sp.]